MSTDTRPCGCWWVVALHEGHCCFRGDAELFSPDVPLPCGHDDPRLKEDL